MKRLARRDRQIHFGLQMWHAASKRFAIIAIDYSNVKRWVQRFKKSTEDHEEVGKVSIANKPRSGRPSTSVNPDNKTYAIELIRTDRCITVKELASKLDVSIGSAHSIAASLGYSKVCARWVPRQLTEDKSERVHCCTQLLEHHHGDPTFLERIITGDETWVFDFEPESKRRSMEWCHPTSPRIKKFKAQNSAGKIMATVFWDSQGVILVDFLLKGKPLTLRYTLRLLGSSKQKFNVFGPTWTWQMCSSSMTMHVLKQASGQWRPSLHLDGL